MANDSANPNEQCIAPHEASDPHPISQDSRDPRNRISAQQAIDEVEAEMDRFLSAMFPTPTAPTRDTIFHMTMRLINIAPTEIDNEFATRTPGSAILIAHFGVPGAFVYSPESMRSLRREFILVKGPMTVRVHPDPARTPRAQIQDTREFKRRCPYFYIGEHPNPGDEEEWEPVMSDDEDEE